MKKLLLSFGVVFMAVLGLNNVNAQSKKVLKLNSTKKYTTTVTSNTVVSHIALLNSKTPEMSL